MLCFVTKASVHLGVATNSAKTNIKQQCATWNPSIFLLEKLTYIHSLYFSIILVHIHANHVLLGKI